MAIFTRAFVSSLVVVLAFGCSKSARDDNHVVLSVNGQELTRGELKASVGMMVALKKACGQNISPQEMGKIRADLSETYPDAFINRVLVEEYARREKVEASDKLLKQFKGRAVQGLPPEKFKKYADVRKVLGEKDFGYFDRLVRFEALQDAVKAHLVKLTPTNLPPDYVKMTQKNAKAYNEMMSKTNKLIFARADMVWKKLKAGADFGEMAAKYSEVESEREDRGEWGTIDLNQFKDEPKIYEWAPKLKVGEFTPPIEGDNGLMIMRLDGKDEAKGEYTFSRIFFCLPMFVEKMSRKDILDEVHEIHREKLFEGKLEEWRKAAKIEYFDRKNEEGKAEGGRK